MTAKALTQKANALVWLGLGVYTVVRLALLPSDAAVVPGFGHDSAYVAVVARNLVEHRGYVNDGHWLVFLNPERLPMPYHNANPLYPTLTAGVAWVTARDTAWAGLAVSAMASSMLFAALYFVAVNLAKQRWQAALLAGAGTFFPAIFEDSFFMLPDALCTALTACAVACAVNGRGVGMMLLGGASFGLAWLTRSSVILVLPAVGVYIYLRNWGSEHSAALAQGNAGGDKMPGSPLGRIAAFMAAACFIAMPWLIHTAATWGNPFRSDAAYYLTQDYHALAFGGSTERFWHSPTPPPSLAETIQADPGGVFWYYVRGIPILLKSAVAGWTASNFLAAGLMASLLILAVWRFCLGARSSRQGQGNSPAPNSFNTANPLGLSFAALSAVLVYLAAAVVAFAFRGRSLELRYLAPLSLILAILLMLIVVEAIAAPRKGLSSWLALLLGAVWWLGWTPLRDWQTASQLASADEERLSIRQAYRFCQGSFSRAQPVVVGFYPYYFAHFTGSQALSIPVSDDTYLLDYMDKYGAKWVLLSGAECRFWRPDWEQSARVPAFLRLVNTADGFTLYERIDGTPQGRVRSPD